MTERNSKVLSKSVLSAALNIAASVFIRLFTFVTNAFILRRVTKDVLGIGVRNILLYETVVFLSREAFRKSCLSKPQDGNWKGTINLVWASVVIGAVLSTLLGHVWCNILELPSTNVDQYLAAVKLMCLSSIVMLLSEPFYTVGQVYLHVKFRTVADLFFICFYTAMQSVVAFYWPEKAVILYAAAHLLDSCIFVLAHVVYFYLVIRRQNAAKKKDDSLEVIPFESINDFLPSGFNFDKERRLLFWSFFKQGFLKQLLTEGEKYMFTWFSLMTIPEQGVYDVIANLGSIPARMFFSKLEESAHLYFSQTIKRGELNEKDAAMEKGSTQHLNILLKALIVISLVVCTFGMSFAHMALNIYGGSLLSSGIGPDLLRAHCFLVMFLAINGITECYAFCAMTQDQVSRYNYKMAVMTCLFLGCTYWFVKIIGPVGFIVANCCNFLMRIANNIFLINERFNTSSGIGHPLNEIWPSKTSILVLLISGGACHFSEIYLYGPNFKRQILHLLVGAAAFLVSMIILCVKESWLKSLVVKLKEKVL